MTTGSSILQVKEGLEAEGLVVKQIAVLIDRRENHNFDVFSLLKMSDFREFISSKATEIWKTIQDKKTNLCFSFDGGNLALLEKIAPWICMVKIHTDTGMQLIADTDIYLLAEKYNFHVLDDRKYADIGYIVEKQAETGGDLCTVHGIFGQSTLDGLKEKDCVLIAESSAKDNFILPAYTQLVFELGKENGVVGFISQQSLGDSRFLYLTPGVNNSCSGDSQGQGYKPVDEVIKQGTDIIIVGRGIYEAADPVEAARSYSEAGWKALCERM